MNKLHLLYGFMIGLAAAALGSFIFIEVFTPFHFNAGIAFMSTNGLLGKIITLGAIMNLAVFFILLKLKREVMARGVVFATIILTALTLLV